MTKTEMKRLSDEELRQMANHKTRKHTNTPEAEEAMAILRERAGIWDNVCTDKPSNDSMEAAYHGWTVDRYE